MSLPVDKRPEIPGSSGDPIRPTKTITSLPSIQDITRHTICYVLESTLERAGAIKRGERLEDRIIFAPTMEANTEASIEDAVINNLPILCVGKPDEINSRGTIKCSIGRDQKTPDSPKVLIWDFSKIFPQLPVPVATHSPSSMVGYYSIQELDRLRDKQRLRIDDAILYPGKRRDFKQEIIVAALEDFNGGKRLFLFGVSIPSEWTKLIDSETGLLNLKKV